MPPTPAAPNERPAPERAAPYILPLQEIADEPVGGKAAGLARLIRMGLRVPAGFVIVGARHDALPGDLADHYRRLSRGGEDVSVAVRSSAIGEDSAGASFAGQYETVLDVRGEAALRDAIDRCLDSLRNDRATAYQAQKF